MRAMRRMLTPFCFLAASGLGRHVVCPLSAYAYDVYIWSYSALAHRSTTAIQA
jgi:hypothetical protein